MSAAVLPAESSIRAEDINDVLRADGAPLKYRDWAPLLGKPLVCLDLTEPEASALMTAYITAGCLGRRPRFPEDIADTLAALEARAAVPWPAFVRYDAASVRDSPAGYPVLSAKELVTALCTSFRGYSSLQQGDRTVYMVPYDARFDTEREYRLYVYNGRVTGCCPWAWDEYNEFYDGASADDVLAFVARARDAYVPRLNALYASYVLDVLRTDAGEVVPVEVNAWERSGAGRWSWKEGVLTAPGGAVALRRSNATQFMNVRLSLVRMMLGSKTSGAL